MGDSRPSSRPRLVHRVFIRAPATSVWRAITDPQFTEQYFFGLAVRAEWKKGARIVYADRARGAFLEGTIEEVSPPRLLRFSASLVRDADAAGDPPSRITWEIVPLADGCELTVVHDGFENETSTYRRLGGGWPLALEGLKELVLTGRAVEAQKVWPRHLERPSAVRWQSRREKT